MRGQADYGALAPKETTAGVSDMGEVAARLGSIVTYDKRGDVIDFDNFEEPVLKWSRLLFGAGSAIYLDSESVKSGSQVVKLCTGDISGAYALLEKYSSILPSKRLGIEVSFQNLGACQDLFIWFVYYSGTAVGDSGLKVSASEGKVYIYDENADLKEVITGAFFSSYYHSFDTLKLVVDFTTGYYVRLLFNNTEYDLSAEAFSLLPSLLSPLLLTQIQISNLDTTGGFVWVDDVIWTQAEP